MVQKKCKVPFDISKGSVQLCAESQGAEKVEIFDNSKGSTIIHAISTAYLTEDVASQRTVHLHKNDVQQL